MSALVLLPAALVPVALGGIWLLLLVEAAALVGLWEFYRLSRLAGANPPLIPGLLALAALVVFVGLVAGPLPPLITIGAVLALGYILVRKPAPSLLTDSIYAVTGVLYLGLLSLAPPLRALDHGLWWAWLLLAATFATDTAAFFTGRAIGRHPLAPAISAGKTREGAVGGLAAAMIVTLLIGALSPLGLPWWQSLLLGLLIGVFAQLGDLAESAIKRSAGAKDAGTLIPGHGGLLDRLDSVVFSLAVVYHFAIAVS